MLTVKDIKKILDENNIKYNSYGDKEYYLGLLLEHGLVPGQKIPAPEASIKLEYEPKPVPDPDYERLKVDPKYKRLKTIKKNPRKVILEDAQTGFIKPVNLLIAVLKRF